MRPMPDARSGPVLLTHRVALCCVMPFQGMPPLFGVSQLADLFPDPILGDSNK